MKIGVVLYHLVMKTMKFKKKIGQIGGHIGYQKHSFTHLNLFA